MLGSATGSRGLTRAIPVEADCPQAFLAHDEAVPIRPTVHGIFCRRHLTRPKARMLRAAFSSRSSTRPHRPQRCVRMLSVFSTSLPQPEQACVVYWGGAARTG